MEWDIDTAALQFLQIFLVVFYHITKTIYWIQIWVTGKATDEHTSQWHVWNDFLLCDMMYYQVAAIRTL